MRPAESTLRALGIVVVSLLGIALLFGAGVLRCGDGADAALARRNDDQAERGSGAKERGKQRRHSKRAKGKKRGRKGKGKGKGKKRGRKGKGKGKARRVAATPTAPLVEIDALPSGVSGHVEDDAWGGLSLYAPVGWSKAARKAPKDSAWLEATLIDAAGTELHRWHVDDLGLKKKGFSAIDVGPDGSLFTLIEDAGVYRLGWDSSVLWRAVGPFKAAFTVLEDGRVVTVVEKLRDLDRGGGTYLTIRDQGLTIITADGSVGEAQWLYDVLREDPAVRRRIREQETAQRDRLDRGKKATVVDLFGVSGIDGSAPAGDAPWPEDALLLSLGHLDALIAISSDGQASWRYDTGDLQFPQSAALGPGGRVVVFDGGRQRKWSRALVLEPATSQIAWSVPAGPAPRFFTKTRGFAQLLPNDNVLVVLGREGTAYEFTPAGDPVWSFGNPYTWNDKRLPIRLLRLTGAKASAIQGLLDDDE